MERACLKEQSCASRRNISVLGCTYREHACPEATVTGPGRALPQLREHAGCEPPLYVLCADFLSPHPRPPFYSLGLQAASERCHSLRSVHFLLPIKMQIHYSMHYAMDLGKPWRFLLTILCWFNFNLNCLSKLSLFS